MWADCWFDSFNSAKVKPKKVAVLIEAKFADTVGKTFIEQLKSENVEISLLCFWTHQRFSSSLGRPLFTVSRTFQESVDGCEEFICLQPEGILEIRTAPMLSYAKAPDNPDVPFLFLKPYGSLNEPVEALKLDEKFRRVTVVTAGFVDFPAYGNVLAPDPDDYPEIVKTAIIKEMQRIRENAASETEKGR